MHPKDRAQMMAYMLRSGVKDKVKFASDIARPNPKPQVKEIKLFNEFNKRNPKADGGRIGFSDGPKKILTGEKFIEIAEKFPDKSNKELLEYFNKNNFVNRTGDPLSLGAIKTQKSKFFDIAAETKSKIPNNYVKSTDVFENLPISRKDYFRVKQAKEGGTLLTQEIDKLLKPVKIGETFYFKKPTKGQIETFQKISSRKGQLKPNTINLMLEFDKKFGDKYAKGELPLLKDPTGKNKNTIHNLISKDITPTTAGNVTARLSQWYNGTDFLNPELKSIKRNKTKAKNIQKASSAGRYGNFYADQAYKIALDTIDEKIGRRTGTFKEFKDNISKALKEAGLPIYSKNSPFGFNLNEIAGVTGAARTKTAAFSDFVDIAEGKFNQKQLSTFQKEFTKLRENLDKLNLSKNIQNRKKAQSLINDFQDTIKYYEKETGSKLPNIGLGTADQYYSAERLEDIARPKKVGETGKKMFRQIPGTDLIKASKDAGYTVVVPENYRTVGQIMETGQRGVLKKNVQNTLEGMKKFFNEYDEKKMFQKLKNATPDTLRKMMRVIPKVASLEDDFLNAYGFPLTASFDPNIGIKSIEEDTFARRNPITTGAGLSAAGTAAVLKATGTPIRTALGKAFRGAGTRLGVLPFAAMQVKSNIDKGENIADAVIDPLVGLELSLPGVLKENLSKITTNPTAQRILNLGRFARFTTPVGLGITAAGLGIDAAKAIRARKKQLDALTPDQKTELFRKERQQAVMQNLRGGRNAFDEFSAADGGMAGLSGGKKSGPAPISGPTPHGDEGLPAAFKRVKKQ
jgi:hypothetical protein